MCGILFGCCLCSLSSSVVEKNCGAAVDSSKSLKFHKVDCLSNVHDGEQAPSNTADDIFKIWATDQFINRRGPDVSKVQVFEIMNTVKGLMRGCILHLRGKPTHQPVIDNEGNALLWNGEIFDGISVKQHENDTTILSDLLSRCSSEDEILKVFEQIHGPWSFIYWQAKKKSIWFGRDMFGRRSLLWHLPSSQSHSFAVTSVSVGDLEYTEIPAVGIFSMDCSAISLQNPQHGEDREGESKALIKMTLHPWLHCRWPGTRDFVADTEPNNLPSILKYSPNHVSVSISPRQILQTWMPCPNTNIPEDGIYHSCDHLPESAVTDDDRLVKTLEAIINKNGELRNLAERLVSSLHLAVEKRLNNLPTSKNTVLTDEDSDESCTSKARIAILFSGGLDSSVIAALADRCVPMDEPIDLLNVAFEQPFTEPTHTKPKQKPKKRQKGKTKSDDSNVTFPESETLGLKQTPSGATLDVYSHSMTVETNKGLSALSLSFSSEENRSQSIISGAHKSDQREASSIENELSSIPPTNDSPLLTKANTFDPYDVPDRRTGKMAYSELCHMNPHRQWNFIELNVTQEELQSQRKSRIRKLIYPLCTVLDDSIGCALWFAARGKGKPINNQEQTVVSKARVILCGMAADEQFAGYSRHRAHFNKFGWEGLISQLQEEMWRISQRNLGRDDRIISDHGKEARFPFLDENFTKFVSEIPIHLRADLHLPRGIGEKLLLRISAFMLGFRTTACQAKRAIQFGSKIAKLDCTKEKGSDVCERLL